MSEEKINDNQKISEAKTTTSEVWQQQAGFILKASWFYNKKAITDKVDANSDEFKTKIVGHPNWRFNFSARQSLHRTFEDALLASKTFFKHSDFVANPFYIPPQNEAAPVNFSKKQRVKLIDQIMNAPKEAKAESSGFLRTAFLDDGETALWVTIEEAEYADEIERQFVDKDNPLHSLVGKNCSAYLNYYFDNVDVLEKQTKHFSAEELASIKKYIAKKKFYKGAKLVTGDLKIEDGVLKIGSWSYRLDGEEPEETEEAKQPTDSETETKAEAKSDSKTSTGPTPTPKVKNNNKKKKADEEKVTVKGFPYIQVIVRSKNVGLLIRPTSKGV